MGAGASKQEEQAPKLKEIRLTPQIEDHDYETKKQQPERMLKGGDAVELVVKIQGKEKARAIELLQLGKPKTGMQVSGKQASVEIKSL